MSSFADMEIEVNVEVLLKKLRTNRAKHNADYVKAKKGYYVLLEREFTAKLATIRGEKVKPSDKKFVHLEHVLNQKPTNYLASYDQVIGMLEFTLDTTVRIDARQYEQYIKNEWSWSNSFTSSNVAYAAAAR